MFDKDKEIGTRIEDLYPLSGTSNGMESKPFVLWAAKVDAERVETDLGEARKTRLQVSDVDSDAERDRTEVTTLASAIADKAEGAEDSDFPAIVKLMQVPSKKYGGTALVLQYVRPYEPKTLADFGNDEDGEAPAGATTAPATRSRK